MSATGVPKCSLPSAGWHCNLADGHDGPCPAYPDRVWEGPRRTVSYGGFFGHRYQLVQIGWWCEPEASFLPITEPLTITGSAVPVYCEAGD